MKYQYYTANDFALDQHFQQWVLNLDEENSQFWNEFIQLYPHKRKEIAEAFELIRISGLSTDPEANTAFLEVWTNVQRNAESTEKKHRLNRAFRYSPVAAVWLGLLLLAIYILWNKDISTAPVTYTTRYGEIKKIALADGSTITLNANSTLQLSGKNWSQASVREVFLAGEAFFEVAQTRDKKKFIVKTADSVTVQVLGTEFNVNTRREKTAVYLQSGKVQFSASTEEVMLKPGDFAEYNQQEKKVNIGPAKEESKLAWKNNFFVFDDMPLIDIGRELEDNYGTKVIIADDSLARKRFTARIPRNKVNVLLKVLAETLEIDMVKQHDAVRMQFKNIQTEIHH